MKRIAIYSCGTAGYAYAMIAQARRVAANLALSPVKHVRIILVSDKSGEINHVKAAYEALLPDAEIVTLELDLVTGGENYKTSAQLLIAQMRTAATGNALAWGADHVWSLDSDVLPPPNALRCMRTMLEFDGGWYGVAFCPYPSQGGGGFLSGHGSPTNPIFPDFHESEKKVPVKLTKARDSERKKIEKEKDESKRKEIGARLNNIEKEIRAIPPAGNVFEMNAKAWKRRGWFDQAYPAIGQGAVVPVEWTGFGCLLMGREAAVLCDWIGYDGSGTEDLFINFQRWHPAGIKICSIPHCPCEHVLRSKDGIKLMAVGHEMEGECKGHLRRQERAWYSHEPGEQAKNPQTPA